MPDIFVDKKNPPETTGDETENPSVVPPIPAPQEQPPPPLSAPEQEKNDPAVPISSETPAANPPPPLTDSPWREQHKANITMLQEPLLRPSIFTSYAPRPVGISFENQESHEEIVLFLRRHFATNAPWFIGGIFLLLIPLLFGQLLADTIFAPVASLFSPTFVILFIGLYYLMVLGFLLNSFVTWFYQVGLITNLRVIDVDFNSLLARNTAYTDIIDIVDTESHQTGVVQGIFNFGTVQIQTAGMKANFEFSKIPKPDKVVDLISDLMREIKHHG